MRQEDPELGAVGSDWGIIRLSFWLSLAFGAMFDMFAQYPVIFVVFAWV